jgi:hypothetical protein
MLNPQDFARLLQDKLIEAGEQRAVEFKADLFGFVPRGGDLASIFPLDNYYRMYLSAASDGDRQRAIRQFTGDWLRYAKSNAPVAPGAGGAPAGFAPSPLAGPGHAAPFVGPNPFSPAPPAARPPGYGPPKSAVGCGGRVLVVIFALVGIAFVCFCGGPIAMLGLAKGRLGPGRGPPWGREWDRHPPADAQLTEFIGGQGGGPRYYYDADRRPVIGLAFTTGEWSRQKVIQTLVPLYDDHVPPPEGFQVLVPVRGKEGYVVGGLEVNAGDYVNAVRITFVRRTDQGLDLSDTYQSDWLGTPTPGRDPRKLAGNGEEILGIAAHRGIVLDSVGLLYRPPVKPPEPMPEPAPAENPPPAAENPAPAADPPAGVPMPDFTPLLPDSCLLTLVP